ncbi:MULTISPECIES: CBS domain-containing protein [Xanthobacter]|uniref:CBS domain-containing protein n=1 Tax=Xanthobacter flavus TaxID=281 RepID=A0A9W6CPQ7_XANFL|nr:MULTISPECIES: CBS domain-containing protein [Xanthobacter]MBN8918842.1 CBS domain-containing protein [Hyphomicrobiales bacterium]MDR6334312.1 CBS domain-containing protein [Xanthobacter flavus]UJX44603.1 CBS domain-containing protein [Xanthobacter sp. YC-JY1]GLI23032.1 histidine kinase [Xanthobacter flavus]
MITVDDILREKRDTRIITLRMHETVADAVLVMKRENISSVIIKDVCRTEGNTVVGVFSERDVTRAVLEHGANTPKVVLASLMKRDVISCTLEDTIETVLRLMVEHQVRHLPVMESYALVGVISATDLMRHYLKESEAHPALEAVSGGIEAGLAALR